MSTPEYQQQISSDIVAMLSGEKISDALMALALAYQHCASANGDQVYWMNVELLKELLSAGPTQQGEWTQHRPPRVTH